MPRVNKEDAGIYLLPFYQEPGLACYFAQDNCRWHSHNDAPTGYSNASLSKDAEHQVKLGYKSASATMPNKDIQSQTGHENSKQSHVIV